MTKNLMKFALKMTQEWPRTFLFAYQLYDFFIIYLEFELGQILPCAGAGQFLSGFDRPLPYLRKDHDLAEMLSLAIVKDASNHPKKPTNEQVSTILNTQSIR